LVTQVVVAAVWCPRLPGLHLMVVVLVGRWGTIRARPAPPIQAVVVAAELIQMMYPQVVQVDQGLSS